MMSNIKNIPKRRFSNFEEEWEEKKLEELSNIVRGASPRPIQDPKWFDEKSEIGWLRISDVSEQDGRIYKLEQRLSELGQQKTRVVHEPHLLMSIAATVGKPVINYIKTGVHDGFLIFLEPKFNLEFMFKWLEMYKNQWKRYGQPGSQLNLNSDIVKNQTIILPECNEQVAIGSFFQLLDQSITLHQHKLDKLKNLKKSYLAELFPAEGERVPKRRFPGFEGEWEIRKLKELTEYRRGSFPQPYGKNEWYGGIGSMPFVQVVDVLSNLKLAETTKQQISKLAQNQSVFVPQGTVVITLQGSIGRVAITQYDSYVDRTLLIFEKFLFPTDIYYWALSMQQKFDIESKKAPGGTIKTITKEALSEFEIFLPTLEEQKQIGEFFQKLDKSISLQQEKLNKLKDLKKAYLNELFV